MTLAVAHDTHEQQSSSRRGPRNLHCAGEVRKHPFGEHCTSPFFLQRQNVVNPGQALARFKLAQRANRLAALFILVELAFVSTFVGLAWRQTITPDAAYALVSASLLFTLLFVGLALEASSEERAET